METTVSNFNLNENYRIFKAKNKYNYPFLFFFIGFLNGTLQLAIVAAATWFLYSTAADFIKFYGDEHPVVALSSAPAESSSHHKASFLEVAAKSSSQSADSLSNREVISVIEEQSITSAIVNDWKWVFQQPEGQFTIQYRSSPDKELLYEEARQLPATSSVGVFPFKKTSRNQLLYGYASGTYDTLESAEQTIQSLPPKARAHGPWIRPIKELQEQVARTLANE